MAYIAMAYIVMALYSYGREPVCDSSLWRRGFSSTTPRPDRRYLFLDLFGACRRAHAEGLDRVGGERREGLGETRLQVPSERHGSLGGRRRHPPKIFLKKTTVGLIDGAVRDEHYRALPTLHEGHAVRGRQHLRQLLYRP